MAVICGIDPGARDTGIIIIDDKKITAYTVHNTGELLPPPQDYINQILGVLADHITSDTVTKVESITKPNWHVAKNAKRGAASNPTAIIGTAVILGAIMAAHPKAILIPPGKNGSKPLGAYPPELVSAGEKRKPGWELRIGTGKLRHQRSAYDIAKTGV